MALAKCPRCELNYILDGDKLCTVCRREVSGEVAEVDDLPDLCSECGEMPTMPGSELCINCLKDMARRVSVPDVENTIDAIAVEDPVLEINSVSAMDEIQIDIGGGLEGEEFDGEDEAFTDEIDEEDDDDDLLDR